MCYHDVIPECDCPSHRLCTIYGDCICDDHHVPTRQIYKRKKRQVNCLLIGFVLIACRLIQTSFQATGVGKRTHEKSPTFKFGSIEITCDEEVKLLGVDIDFKLSFENHISILCKKEAKQLNVLKRIGKKP